MKDSVAIALVGVGAAIAAIIADKFEFALFGSAMGSLSLILNALERIEEKCGPSTRSGRTGSDQ